MRILFIGDIVGAPGRRIVVERLEDIIGNEQADLVIANGENSASGFGITPRLTEELLSTGIEVLSGGNHIWDRKEILDFIPREPRLLRPANFPAATPGKGLFRGTSRQGIPYAVLCLQGRIFMASNEDPFATADRELASSGPGNQSDPGGHTRRGDQRKAGHGLVSRRPRLGRGGNAHARAHRGRTDSAQRHGLHHRRRA